MKAIHYIWPLLFIVSCQKEIKPLVETPEAVFSTSFTVNGEKTSIVAGDDGFFMFSDVSKDSIDVENYSGTLANIQDPKRNAISFHFRSATPNMKNLDSSLKPGHRDLLSNFCGVPVSTKFTVKLSPVNNRPVTSQTWIINGVINNIDSTPVFTFDTNEVKSLVIYLHSDYGDCIASTMRCIDFENYRCMGRFEEKHLGNSSFYFAIPSDDLPEVKNATWYVENQTFQGFNLIYDLPVGPSETFIYSTIDYKDGCSSCYGKKIVLGPNNTVVNCENDIHLQIEEEINYEHLQLGKVEVNYWDHQGKRYSTKWGAEPGELEIVSIEEYKVDRNGNPTKKVHLRGTITVYTLSGSPLVLEDLDATIAVAY